jgi:transcriptional regulator with XRE-family HTH domain
MGAYHVCMSKSDKQDRFSALGARLKFLREQWQQSVRDVCETLEISEDTLKALESGAVPPSPEVLDMLISHFLLTEDQAQDLRDLAGDAEEATAQGVDDILNKGIVMFMPIDNRVVYTDAMQATVTENGVVLQFMQQSNGQSIPVSKVGMSRHHAEKVIEVLQKTLDHHDRHQGQKQLPPPSSEQS